MNSVAQVRPDKPRCRVAPSALAMLAAARQGLAGAEDERSAGGRYVAAHLAALRAAAAVVAARAEPAPSARRKRPRSVWELLPRVEPALSEWAAFFAAGAGKRAAAEAGLPADSVLLIPRTDRPDAAAAPDGWLGQPERQGRCGSSEGVDGSPGLSVQDAPADQFLGQVCR